jgi:hypothetical protein
LSADSSVPETETTAATVGASALSSVERPLEHGHDGAFVCPNCDAANRGRYCSRCGQQQLHDGDLSLRHAWHHVLHETLHVDGKLFGTLRSLFTRPGQLTIDFVEGRRQRHVHPLRLFLLFSALFVLASASNFTLGTILDRTPEPAPAGPRVELNGANPGTPRLRARGEKIDARLRKEAEQAEVPYALFVEHLDKRLTTAFKLGYTGAIVANGFWFALLFRRRFRYLAEHMVFALYWSSFGMVINTVGGRLNHWLWHDAWPVAAVLMLTNYGYYLLAARRVYQEPWTRLALKGLVPILMTNLIVIVVLGAVLLHAVL